MDFGNLSVACEINYGDVVASVDPKLDFLNQPVRFKSKTMLALHWFAIAGNRTWFLFTFSASADSSHALSAIRQA